MISIFILFVCQLLDSPTSMSVGFLVCSSSNNFHSLPFKYVINSSAHHVAISFIPLFNLSLFNKFFRNNKGITYLQFTRTFSYIIALRFIASDPSRNRNILFYLNVLNCLKFCCVFSTIPNPLEYPLWGSVYLQAL